MVDGLSSLCSNYVMTYQEAKSYLDSLINFELRLQQTHQNNFGLEGIKRLLNCLGDPQHKLKFIHVAGTKGKGSTCLFIASILRKAGYRVGLYTSPHFYEPTERVRIFNPDQKTKDVFEGQISRETFARLVGQLKPTIEKLASKENKSLTYFEVLTALAILYFVQQRVDCVVWETGMGGRLDATNVVDALISVITPIGMDHTKQLGTTILKIAFEKAAIIKGREKAAVIALQNSQALKVIARQCRKLSVPQHVAGKDFSMSGVTQGSSATQFTVEGLKGTYKRLTTRLLGQHQSANAAVAIAVVELLGEHGFPVRLNDAKEGIKSAIWPGRCEIVQKNPIVLLDCAHNCDSAKTLAETLRVIFKKKNFIFMIGVSSDKDIASICRIWDRLARQVILTRARHARAHTFTDRDRKIFKNPKKVHVTKNAKDALGRARSLMNKDSVLVVTGSIFLVAEARKELCTR